MKKLVALCLTVLMLLCVVLTACSNSVGPGSAPESKKEETQSTSAPAATDTPSQPAENVTITLMEVLSNDLRTEWFDRRLPEFTALSGVTVERELVPWEQAHDRLVTLVASKSLPDVLETAANWLPEFAATGAYENLEPYYSAWDKKDEIADLSLKLGRSYDNSLYVMPYGLYLVTMMYRSDWLQEAGLSVPATIEEYYTAMEKLTDSAQNRYGYSFRGGMGNWGLLSMFLMGEIGADSYFEADGTTCVFRRPEATTALEHFGNVYFSGYAPKDALNWGYAETVDAFTSGVTGFLIQDTEVIGVCLEKLSESQFSTAKPPAGKDGRVYLMSGYLGFSVSSFSDKKDASWEFIKWMTSPEVNADWSSNNWLIPSSKAAIDDPSFASGLMAPVGQILKDPTAVIYQHPDHLPEWGEFYSKVSVDELQAYLLGEQTAREMLDNVCDFLEKAQADYLSK